MRPNPIKERTLYRGLIRSAWEIAWHRREFWPLGLLASLLMMNGGAFEFIASATNQIESGAPFGLYLTYAQAAIDAVANGNSIARVSVFFSLLLIICAVALLAILAVAASGGLMLSVARRVTRRKTALGDAFNAGMTKLGPLLLTQIVGRTVIFVLFALAALGVYSWGTSREAIVIPGILFVLFAVGALLVTFLMMMTNAAVMVDKTGWIHAVHNALTFFRRHWLISLEMIGLTFLAAAASVAFIGVISVVLLIPFTLILLAVSALNSAIALSAVAFIYQILILALVLVVGAYLAVFEHGIWTLLYVELRENGAVAKLERLWQAAKNHRLNARLSRR